MPVLVLVLLLGSTVRAAFHHHKGGKFHPECQICLFQQAAANGDSGSVQLVVLVPGKAAIPDYFVLEFSTVFLAFPRISRSPPHLS